MIGPNIVAERPVAYAVSTDGTMIRELVEILSEEVACLYRIRSYRIDISCAEANDSLPFQVKDARHAKWKRKDVARVWWEKTRQSLPQAFFKAEV